MMTKAERAQRYWAQEFEKLLKMRIEQLRVRLRALEQGRVTRVRVRGHRRPARKAHYVKPHWRIVQRKGL